MSESEEGGRGSVYCARESKKQNEDRTPLSVADDEHAHALVVVELLEQFWREEKELAGLLVARDLDHLVMDGALGSRIHTLSDDRTREGSQRPTGNVVMRKRDGPG